MELLLIKIAFSCACIGWMYSDKLTQRDQLLYKFAQLYKNIKWLSSVLNCPYCVAGWLTIIAVLFNVLTFQWFIIPFVFVAPAMSMSFVHAIKSLD